jgi:hypothetical protein
VSEEPTPAPQRKILTPIEEKMISFAKEFATAIGMLKRHGIQTSCVFLLDLPDGVRTIVVDNVEPVLREPVLQNLQATFAQRAKTEKPKDPTAGIIAPPMS